MYDVEIVCTPRRRLRVIGALLLIPLLCSAYVLAHVGFDGGLSIVEAALIVGLIAALFVPVLYVMAASGLSRVRIDRLGVHREGVPLTRRTLRWSEIEEVSVHDNLDRFTKVRSQAVLVKGRGGRPRIVLHERTLGGYERASERILGEAERREIGVVAHRLV